MKKLLTQQAVDSKIAELRNGYRMIPDESPNKDMAYQQMLREENNLQSAFDAQNKATELAWAAMSIINPANPLTAAVSLLKMFDALKYTVDFNGSGEDPLMRCRRIYKEITKKELEPAG